MALPMRSAPAAARVALPPAPRWRGTRALSAGRTRRRLSSTISVALARSSRYIASMAWPNPSSSTITSSSQLPIQLAGLRLVDPTRDQRASATAVLAWSIGPFHSNTRTPASSSGRYPAREMACTIPMSLPRPGTRRRTSTPSRAAARRAWT